MNKLKYTGKPVVLLSGYGKVISGEVISVTDDIFHHYKNLENWEAVEKPAPKEKIKRKKVSE